jgi:hypothetical protein
MSDINELMTLLEASLQDESFVKISLDSYKGKEVDLKNIHVRRVVIKREDKLSFTYRYKTRDIVKNYGYDEGLHRIFDALSDGFQSATLCTTAFDMTLGKGGLKKNPPSHSTPLPLGHDKPKERMIITEDKHYLHALNITDEKGTVFKNAQDKFRQINKYVEILSTHLKSIPDGTLTKIVDMGAGKGYLTFALADYLKGLGQTPDIIGVEFRKDLVDVCNRIARHAKFDNLTFTEGSIQNFDSTGATVLIALHACDTATDDAIFKGITAGAELIVVAPCCHKQIRREIEKNKKSNDLDFLMQYGTFVERQAEMVTDGLRALILNYCGYSTKVFEFISDAHTPKNVMIVATRDKKQTQRDASLLKKIKEAKEFYGVKEHYLEKILGIT